MHEAVPSGIADFNARFDLELWSYASLEAQIAALSDDIAYDAHDIDDGLRAGLFTVDDLREVPLLEAMIGDIDRHYPGLVDLRRGAELVRELISYLIAAVAAESQRRIERAQPMSPHDVRRHAGPLVAFPADVAEHEATIKRFLWQRMYRHERVMRVMRDAERIVADLFGRYQADPASLPAGWLEGCDSEGDRARRIGHFIAGMTDRFALTEHHRLFDSTPDLR